MNKQKKVLLSVILLIIILMGIGYASITHNTLIISGTATASADNSNFKVYFTGEVPKTYSSESHIIVEAKPNTHSQTATVNILNLSNRNDSAYAILEIENGSADIDAKSITVTTTAESSELFEINVIMCDVEGNEITDYGVSAGEKTYTKLFVKLLKTVLDNETAAISATITAVPKDPSETPIIPDIPDDPISTDLFGAYYAKAEEKMQTMTQDEKIAQMYVIGTSSATNYTNLNKYNFGGHLYLLDSFKDTSGNALKVATVKNQIATSQSVSKIPLLMSIDEEGEKVSRLNSTLYNELNTLKIMPEKFRNSSVLFNEGGLNKIKEDTIYKSSVLTYLGFNLNFAPDVDMADSTAYIYARTLQQDAATTAEFAKTVIQTGKNTGVSYSLKHFPGYGNSIDTHSGFATDNRSLSEFESKDLIPFKGGIEAGAEVVMVAHNIVTCFDSENPASISKSVHDYLRNNMNYTGIIITDAINMGAVADKYSTKESVIKAIQSGNDMICLSMNEGQKDMTGGATLTYSGVIKYISDAVADGQISQETIDTAVRRILAWKYYKGLITD